MIIPIFTITYDPPPALPKREFNRIVKEAWAHAGAWWHAKYRPKHFTEAGAKEYRYTPRKGANAPRTSREWRRSHTARKLRLYGHTDPLSYTGESEGQSENETIRATRNGVKVSMPTNTLNFRPKGGRINLANELRAMSEREKKVIANKMSEAIDRGIRGSKVRKKITIKPL